MLARQGLQALQFPLLPSVWCRAAQWFTSTISQPVSSQQQQQVGPDAYADSFKSPVESLHFPRGEVKYPQQLESNVLGRMLLTVIGAYSRQQQLRNGAAMLYQAITVAAEDTQLQQALGLDPQKFLTPHTLLSLHVWLVINRLHLGGGTKDAKHFQQSLYTDYFFKDVERRVRLHGVTIHVNKWMKKLEQQFYGSCMAYDLALRQEGGATVQQAAFANALLKNVYEGDDSRRAWAHLLARYLSRELQCLGATDVDHIYKGHIRFSTDIKQSKG
eukprot:GHRR01010940.1.p1 GENE.GHRR01010940.1~~GHRR01010940.1.p1  ORF type:complete len:273 (+),score=67.92 GHRR01010940.1:639-1457(+)